MSHLLIRELGTERIFQLQDDDVTLGRSRRNTIKLNPPLLLHLPTLIAQGLQGRLPPLVDPEISRDFVHADDVCDAFVRAVDVKTDETGAIYNIGSGRGSTIREVVDLARERLGIAAEPRWGSYPNRSWDTTVWVSDNTKARQGLGWQCRHSLRTGFDTTVAWMKAHPDLLTRYLAEG